MATLHLETVSFDAWTDALVVELRRLSAHPLRAEAAERIVESVQRACRSVGALHLDRGAAPAGNYRIALQVPERAHELLAALRAFDGNGELARRAQVEGVIPMTRRGAA